VSKCEKFGYGYMVTQVAATAPGMAALRKTGMDALTPSVTSNANIMGAIIFFYIYFYEFIFKEYYIEISRLAHIFFIHSWISK